MYTIKTSFVVLFVIITSILVGLSFRPSSKVDVDTMRAVVTVADGKIELKEVPIPTPEFGEVLVKVAYAPINPSDVYHALRDYAVPGTTKTFPYMNGLEGSGVVVGHGGGVLPMIYSEMGARVSFAIGTGGSWAEYVKVPAMTVVPLPEDVDLKSGSAATVNPLTVIGFLEVAREGNHKAMVHTAANSALGLMLLRAAESHDLTVVCVVRGEKNQNILVKDLNYPSDLVVRSDLPNFEEELQKVVKKTKATLAFDAVGGKMSQQIYDAMPKKSQTFSYGLLSGEFPPESLLENKNSVKAFDGFHLKSWLDAGGLPRLVTVAMKGRSMLANELKTEFHQVLEFDNDIIAKIEEYNRHQKGGKMVMKMD